MSSKSWETISILLLAVSFFRSYISFFRLFRKLKYSPNWKKVWETNCVSWFRRQIFTGEKIPLVKENCEYRSENTVFWKNIWARRVSQQIPENIRKIWPIIGFEPNFSSFLAPLIFHICVLYKPPTFFLCNTRTLPVMSSFRERKKTPTTELFCLLSENIFDGK